MGQSFKFTFKILKNTKGFISSMVIMPVIMILLVSMTLAYSEIPVVGYIGEKAPNISSVKMMKLEADEKGLFSRTVTRNSSAKNRQRRKCPAILQQYF